MKLHIRRNNRRIGHHAKCKFKIDVGLTNDNYHISVRAHCQYRTSNRKHCDQTNIWTFSIPNWEQKKLGIGCNRNVDCVVHLPTYPLACSRLKKTKLSAYHSLFGHLLRGEHSSIIFPITNFHFFPVIPSNWHTELFLTWNGFRNMGSRIMERFRTVLIEFHLMHWTIKGERIFKTLLFAFQ